MRAAKLSDVPRLLELSVALHAESRFSRFPVNLEKAECFFIEALTAEPGHSIFLVDGDPIHALFLAAVKAFWWGDALEAADITMYVSPEKRGGPSAARFIREYKRITKSLGVIDTKLAIGTEIHTERTGRFYETLGFKQYGLLHLLTE